MTVARSEAVGKRRAVLTRSEARAAGAAHVLSRHGIDTVAMPVTETAAIGPDAGRDLERALAALSSWDWVVFASSSAVRYFAGALEAAGCNLRSLARARIACVGRATCAALAERGFAAEVIAERADALGLADAVIAAAGKEISSARVVWPRAAEGRLDGIERLRAAGATVEAPPVYRTEPTPKSDPRLAEGLAALRKGEVDAIAFFAPSQVRALFDLLGPGGRDQVASCGIVAAIGTTTRRALAELGIDEVMVSPKADAVVLAEQIARALSKEHDQSTMKAR